MRTSKKREHYWDGFRDALVDGRRDPTKRHSDSAEVAYAQGFEDGKRAADRLTKGTAS